MEHTEVNDEKSDNQSGLLYPLSLSIIWIGFITAFLCWRFENLEAFANQDFNNIGDFFAGAFAPLATVWLVYAVLIQSKQLRMQSKELRLQRLEYRDAQKTQEAQRKEMEEAARQARAQANGITANEQHARKDTFFRLVELIEREIVSHASRIYEIVIGTEIHQGWERFGYGDPFFFQRAMRDRLVGNPKLAEVLSKHFETRIAAARYIRLFEKILEASDACDDPEQNIRGQFEWSPNGEFYAILCNVLGEESKIEIADHTRILKKIWPNSEQ